MTWEHILWVVGLSVMSLIVSLGAVVFLLVQLPPTYFLDSHSRQLWIDQHPVIRVTGIILKNLLGVFFILLGGALTLPGIPGQGLLTMLVGLVLLDFPGKRRVERAILGRPRIGSSVTALRRRFGKPPFQLEQDT